MRLMRVMVVVTLCVLGISVLLNAEQNKFGIADTRNVTFSNPIWVGEALLPVGDYQVLHVMEGDNHIMVFKQLSRKKPAEVRVKCQLVPLKAKANQDEKIFSLNASGERVLQSLIFRGDKAEHRF